MPRIVYRHFNRYSGNDIDFFLHCNLESEVVSRVEGITEPYLREARRLLTEKVDLFQSELRKHIKENSTGQFEQMIKNVCGEILSTAPPAVRAPFLDFDHYFNGDYRFYSERECRKAAENRRERAYNEGRAYVRNLPDTLNKSTMKNLAKILTQWKRQILQAFDSCGQDNPDLPLTVQVGENYTIKIDLTDSKDIAVPSDHSIEDYVNRELLHFGTRIGDVSYMSEYSCKIQVDYDCDTVNTLFGGEKEINKKYAYWMDLYSFESSAERVGKTCVQALEASDFFKAYFEKIKRSTVDALQRTAFHLDECK